MATTKKKERTHVDTSSVGRRYLTRGTTEPETLTLRTASDEGPSTRQHDDDESSQLSDVDIDPSVEESLEKEKKRIQEIKDEIERRKALRVKEKAVRSRIGELEEAIRTRQEFEEELQDILVL